MSKYKIYSEEERLSLLREFQQSGMGQYSFCNPQGTQRHIAQWSLNHHTRKEEQYN